MTAEACGIRLRGLDEGRRHDPALEFDPKYQVEILVGNLVPKNGALLSQDEIHDPNSRIPSLLRLEQSKHSSFAPNLASTASFLRRRESVGVPEVARLTIRSEKLMPLTALQPEQHPEARSVPNIRQWSRQDSFAGSSGRAC